MHFLRTSIRVMGFLLGLFAVVAGVADVLGVVPHSNEIPPLLHRLASNLPLVAAGLALLLPMKRFDHGTSYHALQSAYVILAAIAALKVIDGLMGYLSGRLHWAVVPASIALGAIVCGNAWLLWYMHQGAKHSPNNSLKGDAAEPRALG